MTNHYTQSGRSMIEMLGVLAIIGVLSIGGLAGYTMAMNRHRANQVLDYVSRAAVIALTKGDGSQDINNETCKSLLDGETEPLENLNCTVRKDNTTNDKVVVTVQNLANTSIANALENRSSTQVSIVEGTTSNSVVFTFNNN